MKTKKTEGEIYWDGYEKGIRRSILEVKKALWFEIPEGTSAKTLRQLFRKNIMKSLNNLSTPSKILRISSLTSMKWQDYPNINTQKK